MNLFLIFLAILFVYIIYRVSRRIYPTINVNINGSVSPIIQKMKSLKVPYRPTPWLIGPHAQTIYGMRYRPKHLKYRREIFTFDDNGQCALDFYDPFNETNSFTDGTPIVMIIHTLAGGTREPCSNNLAEAARRKGYRALVYNNRGCSGVPFTSKRFYNALLSDDTEAVIHYLKDKYKPRQLFLVGFSLGAYMAAQYDIHEGLVDGVALVSHTYDGNGANDMLKKPIQRKLYLPVMMTKVTHLLSKDHFVNYPEALKATTLDEYDRLYTCKEYNIESVYDYYDQCCLYKKVPLFKAPTLVLGADNDPFTKKSFMPIKEIEKSDKCAFVHVSEGGHVSFPIGMDAKKSYIDVVVLDFFDTIIQLQQSI
ncbi:Clan SC, family S33, methylesterase-like serine peptidase [Tritrichomonas foetus]|uniref:Clan SC, family S33, methylesterase-like serine peptidase n=1 Tax=Tritrichomonas foetus TaxID=1144522 RepID=A0A1J4K5S7_9EUKA|nr:Clan SC, family S33, methylesterase-like serine peptidase [Tritrichomonas foetus]|eukprot:OHT06809.1 Clan SC, family S33, methylesterase-like serine peptidase [Tritrichomonas foetus]